MRLPNYSTVLGVIAAAAFLFAVRQSAYSQAEKEHRSPRDNSQDSVEVRYARASLNLAKLELKHIKDVNAKTPGTFPTVMIEPVRAAVKIAEAQLDYALHRDVKALHKIHIAKLDADVKTAEDRLQRMVAAKQRSPNAIDNADLDLLRMKVEAVRLAREKAHSIDPQTPIEHLQWQIGELQKEILQLNIRVEQLSSHT